jgi:hypothetical protein
MADPVACKIIERGWAVGAGSMLDRPRYVPSENVGAIEEGTIHLTIDADTYGRSAAYDEPPKGERFLAP